MGQILSLITPHKDDSSIFIDTNNNDTDMEVPPLNIGQVFSQVQRMHRGRVVYPVTGNVIKTSERNQEENRCIE